MSTQATWRATSTAVAWASSKDALNVFNGTSSAHVIYCTRFYMFNNGTAVVTGVLTTVQVRRITAASSGTTVTPVKHDTNNSALDANTTCGTAQTVTGTDIFRRIVYSNKNPVVSDTTMNAWELLVPFAQIFEAGYGDANVQQITCRATQGAEIFMSGSTAVGSVDVEIEFYNI